MAKNVRFALVRTLPVLCGYIFLGMAFGLIMQEAGYGWGWSMLTSLFVYAGSMQFVMVGLMSSGATLLAAAVTALLVNGRHIFYGLTFLDRFAAQGRRRGYMIFSLTDETYSILCRTDVPADVDAPTADFLIALLNQCYWVLGSVLGSALGSLVSFDLTGIDFSMTALFVVILVEQTRDALGRLMALIGFCAAALMLAVMGSDGFLLPALMLTVGLALALRGTIERHAKGGTGRG